MAYEVGHGSWLSASMVSISLKSSHLLESMIMEKLHWRFGRTEDRGIGWLPPVAEEGGFICVFDFPYAIRLAADGRYLLVGECITLGLMMGEAMELSRVDSVFQEILRRGPEQPETPIAILPVHADCLLSAVAGNKLVLLGRDVLDPELPLQDVGLRQPHSTGERHWKRELIIQQFVPVCYAQASSCVLPSKEPSKFPRTFNCRR